MIYDRKSKLNVLVVMLLCLYFQTDKVKRFLAEFYVENPGGKQFKYGEQLVKIEYTSISRIFNLVCVLALDF